MSCNPIIRVFEVGEDWTFKFVFLDSAGAAVAMNGSGVNYRIKFTDKKTKAVKPEALDTAASGALALTISGTGNNVISGTLAKATAEAWGPGQFSASLHRYTSGTDKCIVPAIVSHVLPPRSDCSGTSGGYIQSTIDAATFDLNGPSYVICEGPSGPAPAHEISGTQIRFKNQDGTWGAWMNIAAPVLTAGTVLNPRKTWRQSTAPTYDEVFPPGVQALPHAALASSVVNDSLPWYFWTNSGLTMDFGADLGTVDSAGVAYYQLSGGHTFYAKLTGTFASPKVFDISATNFNKVVVPGKHYEASAYIGAVRCNGVIGITWYGAGYTYISEIWSTQSGKGLEYNSGTVLAESAIGGRNLSDYKRLWVHGIAPAGAVYAHIMYRGQGVGQVDPYLFVTRPNYGKLPLGQVAPSEWTAYEPPMWIDTAASNQTKIYNDTLTGATWL